LPVELLDLALDLLSGYVALVEKFGSTIEQLPLPSGYPRWVDIESTGLLRDGLFICQGGQSDFCLESSTVLFAFLAHL
jgi:hypothetical protein